MCGGPVLYGSSFSPPTELFPLLGEYFKLKTTFLKTNTREREPSLVVSSSRDSMIPYLSKLSGKQEN